MKFSKTRVRDIVKHSNGTYYFKQYDTARQNYVYRSLKTKSFDQAKSLAENVRDKPVKSRRRKSLIKDEAAEFLALKKATRASKTYLSMEGHFRLHLLPYFGDMHVESINEVTWERYIAHCFKKTPGRKLFNEKKYFQSLLIQCHKKGLIARVPSLRNPDPETKAGKVLSDAEIDRLLQHADADTRLKILMAVTMGMRRGEILNLTFDRIDSVRQTIHLRAEDTKTRKARTFAISDACLKLLSGARRGLIRSPYLFPSPSNFNRPQAEFRKSWARCKKLARVSCRFHDLRHTFLTKAFRDPSVSHALVCQYAGLSLQEAMRTYVRHTPEDTRPVASLFDPCKIRGKRRGKQ